MVNNLPAEVFPPEFKGPGGCIHLNKDNGCDIYDERPRICRVNDMFKIQREMKGTPFYKMSRRQYHKSNADLCNTWQANAGMDESYRVNIP